MDRFLSPHSKPGHSYGISALQWYTFDTGMFFTGSFDATLKVWDTNTLEVSQPFASQLTGLGLTNHCAD